MMTAPKSSPTDTFTDTLKAEIVAGSENLSLWLNYVQESGGLDRLFELESWLKGLRCFFQPEHLPLGETDRAELLRRSFAPELRIVRTALLLCEQRLAAVCACGQPDRLEFEAFSGQTRAASASDHPIGRLLEQPTPMDSLTRLMESLDDLRVLVESVAAGTRQDYQVFLALGRAYQKELRGCRYVDMLLSQRFRLQYDRVDNPILGGILRGIADDALRRDVAVALLYLLRFLKYLGLAETEMSADRPLRHLVVLFALLHEEVGKLADFLRSRLLKRKEAGPTLQSAVELVVYSLSMESQRALQRELLYVARETEAPPIYTHIENSHGLLRHCVQSCAVTLVGVFERSLDPQKLFPSMLETERKSLQLRQGLWDLRDYIKQVLDTRTPPDLARLVGRLNLFRETFLRHLTYRDWAQFEQFGDQIIVCVDQADVRTILRKLVVHIEGLVQEVSKRSVVPEHVPEPLAGATE